MGGSFYKRRKNVGDHRIKPVDHDLGDGSGSSGRSVTLNSGQIKCQSLLGLRTADTWNAFPRWALARAGMAQQSWNPVAAPGTLATIARAEQPYEYQLAMDQRPQAASNAKPCRRTRLPSRTDTTVHSTNCSMRNPDSSGVHLRVT